MLERVRVVTVPGKEFGMEGHLRLSISGTVKDIKVKVGDLEVGAAVVGVVGRDGGYTAKVADACIIVPTVSPANVTPHSEAFQAVVWHLFVSHPRLKIQQTKWESTK